MWWGKRTGLRLKREQLEQMVAHCQREAPLEACGLLGGMGGRVTQVFLLTNQDKSPTSYRIDPREQLGAMNAIWERGEELLGIFHSHPTSSAYPSKTDVELAYYPDSAYIIVSLAAQEPVWRAFRITDGIIKEEPVEIEG